MRLIVLTEAEADAVRGPTLQPRLVDTGPYAGSFILPPRVIEDPAHAQHHDLLASLPQADIDPAKAWPAPEDA